LPVDAGRDADRSRPHTDRRHRLLQIGEALPRLDNGERRLLLGKGGAGDEGERDQGTGHVRNPAARPRATPAPIAV